MTTVRQIYEKGCPLMFFTGAPGSIEYASSTLAWFKHEFPESEWEMMNDDGWHWVLRKRYPHSNTV
jgi:hypothetical protein